MVANLNRIQRVGSSLFRPAGLLSLLLLLPADLRADDVKTLAEMLPDNINAVAIVRNKESLATPRAMQENWAAQGDANFIQGQGGVPSWVDTLVVGYLIRPSTAEQVWATGLSKVAENVTIESLAKQTNETPFTIAGYPAIRARGNSIVIGLAPGIHGIRRPAFRQEAARWAEDIRSRRTGRLTPFLTDVVAEEGQILFAIDLQNSLDPELVRVHLDHGFGTSLSVADRDRLTKLISGIKDITLSIKINQEANARVLFEFSDDVGNLGNEVKAVFLDILGHQGAAIEDFDSAKVSSEGKFVTLTSTFSDESLHRVLSLITITQDAEPNPPVPGISTPTVTTPPAPTPTSSASSGASPSDSLRVNRTYFQSIDRMVNDLDRSSRRTNNPAKIALWFNNYANKIDELPIQGVDPDLVNYGASVSSKLRALSRSLQGQVIAVNAEQGTLTYDAQFNPGWASINVWGGIGWREPTYSFQSNLQQVRERQAAAIIAGTDQRIQMWGMLAEERAAMSRKMRERYGQEFISTSRR